MSKAPGHIIYKWETASELYMQIDAEFHDVSQVKISGMNRDVFLSYELLWKLLGRTYGPQVCIMSTDNRIISLSHSYWLDWVKSERKTRVKKMNILQENLSAAEFVMWVIRRITGPLIGNIQNFDIRTIPRTFLWFWLFLLCALLSCFFVISLVISLVHVETVITITPSQHLKTLRQNFTFQEDIEWTERWVAIIPFIKNFQLQDSLPVQNIDLTQISRSIWVAKIENIEPDGFNLREASVFRTEDGVLFRSIEAVYVPPGSAEEPSSAEVRIESLERWEDGLFQWIKWNIPFDTPLTLPGLQGNDRYLSIFSLNDFSGGTNDASLLLTQEEYDRLVDVYTERITLEAERSVIRELERNIREDGFLPIPLPGHTEVITLNLQAYSDPLHTTPVSINEYISEVYFVGQGTFKTMLYNSADLDKHFLTYAKDRLLRGREVLASFGDAPVEFISIQENSSDPFYLRATVQTQVELQYIIEKWGASLQDDLWEVLGLPKWDAKRQLLNNPFVQNIEITNTPFWKFTIAESTENIRIVVSE